MRILSRAAMLGALTATLAAPTAMAGPSTLGVSLSPNKGGTITVGAPTSFNLTLASPDFVPYDGTGGTRLSAIRASLPESLLFNTTGFKQCAVSTFLTGTDCPSATKLGHVDMKVEAGPDFAAPVDASADLWFGSGFTVLARVKADQPAPIDERVVGDLRSSGLTGYGLQMYIPVPGVLSEPIDGVFPVVRSMKAVVTPQKRSVKVPGVSKKVTLPMAGLGPCSGALNFRMDIEYVDAAGKLKPTDTSTAKAKCKK